MEPNSGWDGPVEVDYRFYLPEFSSAMKAGYDRSGIGRRSNKLRESLGLSHLSISKGKDGVPTGITISDMPPYARIQDIGGRVPDRRPKRARAMRFYDSRTGDLTFAKFAAGFDLPGFKYINSGLDVVGERLGLIFEPRWKKK